MPSILLSHKHTASPWKKPSHDPTPLQAAPCLSDLLLSKNSCGSCPEPLSPLLLFPFSAQPTSSALCPRHNRGHSGQGTAVRELWLLAPSPPLPRRGLESSSKPVPHICQDSPAVPLPGMLLPKIFVQLSPSLPLDFCDSVIPMTARSEKVSLSPSVMFSALLLSTALVTTCICSPGRARASCWCR